VAAAVVVLRLLPFPVRLFAAMAARARGAAGFLGLARAGRAAPATGGPLAVLVLAVGVGIFAAAVSGGVTAARGRVVDLLVPGNAIVQGGRFAPSTGDELAAVPGVTAVAPMAIDTTAPLNGFPGTGAPSMDPAAGVVVDVPALQRVLAASGNTQPLPDALRTAASAAPGEPVPAVVSPAVAADLARWSSKGMLTVQGRSVTFTVVAVAPAMPGVREGISRFVVLPWQAMPQPQATQIAATTFALAGSGFDAGALARIGDDG
jgi:putative ABC transport system permease protein